MDFGNGRLTAIRRNIFVFAVLIFINACAIEESKNVYKPPEESRTFVTDNQEKTYTIDDLIKTNEELSRIFNANIDLFSSNKVGFKGNVISEYIDCGLMNNEVYVNYIDRIFGSYLEAVIAFKIQEENDFFRIIDNEIRYTFYSKETGTRWRFRTNKPKELLVGNPVYDDNPYRLCLSKNKLEFQIEEILNMALND